MNQEKAYKLLALQEGISNKSAKDLIDKGLVKNSGKIVKIARALMNVNSKFKLITKVKKPSILFEDHNILAVNKPFYEVSENISKIFGLELIHRLDKGTSGILLLSKNKDYKQEIIHEFKSQRVYKEYVAVVGGMLSDEITIDKPILTIRQKSKIYSKISEDGKSAISLVSPIEIENRQSKLKVVIKTGRTHQIRVHLKSLGYPIIGDEIYGGRPNTRLLLHAKKISFLDYDIDCPETSAFNIV